MKCKHKHRKQWQFLLLVLVGLVASLCISTNFTVVPVNAQTSPNFGTQQEQIGRELYSRGEWEQAAIAWEEAAQAYDKQGNRLAQARALSNFSLASGQLGKWAQANSSITQTLTILGNEGNQSDAQLRILAQAWNTQGIIQLSQGQASQALETWKKASDTYQKIGDTEGFIRSQINQTQAMQALGFYRSALKQLQQVNQTLQTMADSQLKLVGLHSFGNMLRLVGNLNQSQQILERSLTIAQNLQSNRDIALAFLSLGNTAQANQDYDGALNFYQRGLSLPVAETTQIQLQLAQFSLLLAKGDFDDAASLSKQIQTNLDSLPSNHSNIYRRINFAHYLMKLKQGRLETSSNLSWQKIAQSLSTAIAQAKDLGDDRALSYGLGNLGSVYEQTQQWSIAQDLTQQALITAESINATEISYRWQWQLGRLYKAQGDRQESVIHYSQAMEILQSLRSDLVAINPEVQFSFQESVEPVYRQLVSLLLKNDANHQVKQKNLAKARDVIESLQLAELDNFLREACLDAQEVQIDQVDSASAVVYPIILEDRLEVILSLPEQPLKHYSTPISNQELEQLIEKLRQGLVIRSRRDYVEPSKRLYDLLIAPAQQDLADSGVKTLVFIPDGAFRNIPMGVLNDGENYLIEKYSIALTPGLQLLDPRPLQQVELNTLVAGLTEERQGFSSLDSVAVELEQINASIPSKVLVDREFTNDTLEETLQSSPFNVIHIATHGQFSSNLTDTFLLTWDSRISINQLENVLQTGSANEPQIIELLVLSACETAAGDKRAALGLAGMAVRAGASSTMATLWSVNDRATAELMSSFYQKIASQEMTKAEALRQSQLELLENLQYRHPYYWAPYVLLGNWL